MSDKPIRIENPFPWTGLAVEDMLRCPVSGQSMRLVDGGYAGSADQDVRFPIERGIIMCLREHMADDAGVTAVVKDFYEENPFPNYEPDETVGSLIYKSKARVFPEMLNRSIPPNTSVLEVGCGTGQLGNFLSIAQRRVLSVDMCLNSLRLAEQFRSRNDLRNVAFAQMNLFNLPLQPEQFETVICLGVLHHTDDPRGGFESILPFVKKGGHIIIGLYNRYGRMKTRLRRSILSMVGERLAWLDPYIRKHHVESDKKRSWFMDQYRNPHESSHTLDEVLRWFDENGVRFVRAVPSAVFGSSFTLEYKRSLFEPESRGSRMDRLLAQVTQMISDIEGGLFITIGTKE